MGPSSNDFRMYCDRFENQAEEPVPKGVTLAKGTVFLANNTLSRQLGYFHLNLYVE